MTLIPIIIFLLTFYFYEKRRPAEMLVCMLALVTNCFAFVNSEYFIMKPADFVLLPTYYITLRGFFNNKQYFKVKGDRIAQIVLIILCFLLFEFLRTVIFGIDTFANALRVVRIQSLMLLYFYLRKLHPDVFRKFFKVVFFLSLIQGVFFYLQLIGFNLLVGRVDEAETLAETSRYMNYPILAHVFIIYYFFKSNVSIGRKIFVVSFFGVMLILGMTRSLLIGLAVAVVIYLLMQRKIKSVVYLTLGFIFFSIFIQPIFEKRDKQSRNSTMEDIENVLFTKDFRQIDSESGNFSFRIGMLMERWGYLVDNPSSMPLGVGCIHEESPSNKFYFLIGTVNKSFKYGRCMIESGDITWVPLLLRYGFLGVFLFSLLYFYWVKIGICNMTRIKDSLFLTGALIAIMQVSGSFFGGVFDSITKLYLLLIYLSMTTVTCSFYKRRKNENLNSNHLLQ